MVNITGSQNAPVFAALTTSLGIPWTALLDNDAVKRLLAPNDNLITPLGAILSADTTALKNLLNG